MLEEGRQKNHRREMKRTGKREREARGKEGHERLYYEKGDRRGGSGKGGRRRRTEMKKNIRDTDESKKRERSGREERGMGLATGAAGLKVREREKLCQTGEIRVREGNAGRRVKGRERGK